MKKLLFIMLLAATGTCAAQRHPFNSRPYHPPDRQQVPQRETRRPQATPASMPAPRPQPVNVPAPKQDQVRRGK
jgi:hypothetical protein